jgi:type II secretory pathway component PulJ
MTVVELMITTALLGLVMAVVFAALSGVQKTIVTADQRGQTNDQVRLAANDIDRMVRSGNVLYDPASETVSNSGVAPGYSLRIYTQANGNQRCVQWRVRNGVLQTRAWTTTWQVDGNVTGWRNVADHIVNTAAPFTLDPNAAYGGRIVDIDLIARTSSAASVHAAPVEVKVAVTGRNTEYGYDPVVCNTVPTP